MRKDWKMLQRYTNLKPEDLAKRMCSGRGISPRRTRYVLQSSLTDRTRGPKEPSRVIERACDESYARAPLAIPDSRDNRELGGPILAPALAGHAGLGVGGR